MVELKTTMTRFGVPYVSKEIREAFGRNLRIIPNASAAVFFSQGVRYGDVLMSLEIITSDIEHRIALRNTRSGSAGKQA